MLNTSQKTVSNSYLSPSGTGSDSFGGFQSLQANFLYCPNQFFDVLLPNYSRGCIRLVAYMLRQTLGYLDADGNPMRAKVEFSYNNLIDGAKIARGSIREAIDEALQGGFIDCARKGQANTAGRRGNSSLYILRWDDQGNYVKDPQQFIGFFEGEGNRTTIPNEYFDVVVRTEPLSVIRVVGAIIRHTIGWQNAKGGRRQQVQFSFEAIKTFTGIQQNSTVSEALKIALARNYIIRVSEGYFSPQGRPFSSASIYGVMWFGSTPYEANSSKIEPKKPLAEIPERFKNRTEHFDLNTVQKSNAEGFKYRTEERFKNRTLINNNLKESLKQQQERDSNSADERYSAAADPDKLEMIDLLLREGFDKGTAEGLAQASQLENVIQQIKWMIGRSPTKNRLGMLRKAILENWEDPTGSESSSVINNTQELTFARFAYAGYNGNAGTPIAKPSTADSQAAEPLVKEILKVWPDGSRIEEFGKMFGEFWRVREVKDRSQSRALSAALRIHGDAFILEVERRKTRHIRQITVKNREIHEAKFASSWLRYVAQEEERISRKAPSSYAEFLGHREKQFQESLNNPFFTSRPTSMSSMQAALTRNHESEEVRLRELQSYFPDVISDFWTWDKNLNQNPFLT